MWPQADPSKQGGRTRGGGQGVVFGVRDFRGGIVPGKEQVVTQGGEGTYMDHRSFKGSGIF